jgi:hypothetical protein
VESDEWPPHENEYFPRRIMQRLEALKELTQARSANWTNDTAEVTVWPYNDEIVQAVRDRLAPLTAHVEPQDWLPRRLSESAAGAVMPHLSSSCPPRVM